jgi:zinc resistance-associated protein
MKKSILAVTTAVIVAGSAATYAVAQQPPAPPKASAENQWQPSPADRAAFAGARVAALHAGLALTPEQEKLWPPVESVLKDIAQKHEARMEERRAEREKAGPGPKDHPDAMMRLRKGADFMTQTGADLKRLADAAQPLYDKLDEPQKHRLEMMVERRMFERHGMRERVMHRFSEWRDRYDHWRNGDDDGPRGRDRDRDDREDRGNRGPDSGERL